MLLLVIDLIGSNIKHLSIWRGHNNDKFAFSQSKITDKMKENEFLLSDGGFCGPYVITPKNTEFENVNPSDHGSKRSIIENLFGKQALGKWKIISEKVTDSIPFHVLGIRACCEITNIQMNLKPLRNNEYIIANNLSEKINEDNLKKLSNELDNLLEKENIALDKLLKILNDKDQQNKNLDMGDIDNYLDGFQQENYCSISI